MTLWTAAGQAPLSSTTSWSLLKFMSIKLVIFMYLPLNHQQNTQAVSSLISSFRMRKQKPGITFLSSKARRLGSEEPDVDSVQPAGDT